MNPSVSIPPAFQRPFEEFVNLEPGTRRAVAEALSGGDPAFDTNELAARVSPHLDGNLVLAKNFVGMLQSLYISQAARPRQSQLILESLAEVAEEQDRPALREDLEIILKEDSSLWISAKAKDVLTDNERTAHGARVFTDIRPVFGRDPTEEPVASVITHTLKFLVIGEPDEWYATIHYSDLKDLRVAVDRAIKKEETLRSLLQAKGVLPCLKPIFR